VELKIMSEKLYKLEEVLEMEGSEFTARDGSPVKCINGVLNVYCRKKYEACGVSRFWLDNEYKLVKKPVTFEDVLNSNKRCRIEHERLAKDFYKDYDYAYLEFSTYLQVLLNKYNSCELKDILKEGKWYLEE
jgi:hypothetical protein